MTMSGDISFHSWGEGVIAHRESRPRELLSVLACTGQPLRTKNDLVLNNNNAEAQKSWLNTTVSGKRGCFIGVSLLNIGFYGFPARLKFFMTPTIVTALSVVVTADKDA